MSSLVKLLKKGEIDKILSKINDENDLIAFLNDVGQELEEITTISEKNTILKNLQEFFIEALFSDKFPKYTKKIQKDLITKRYFNKKFINDIKKKVYSNADTLLGSAYEMLEPDEAENFLVNAIQNGNKISIASLGDNPSKKVLKAIVSSPFSNIARLAKDFKEEWWDDELVDALLDKWIEGIVFIPKKFLTGEKIKKIAPKIVFNQRFNKFILNKIAEMSDVFKNKDVQYFLLVKMKSNDFDLVIDKDVYIKFFKDINGEDKHILIEKNHQKFICLLEDLEIVLNRIPKEYGKDEEFLKQLILLGKNSINDIENYFGIKEEETEKLLDKKSILEIIANQQYNGGYLRNDLLELIDIAEKKGYFDNLGFKETVQLLSSIPQIIFPKVYNKLTYDEYMKINNEIKITKILAPFRGTGYLDEFTKYKPFTNFIYKKTKLFETGIYDMDYLINEKKIEKGFAFLLIVDDLLKGNKHKVVQVLYGVKEYFDENDVSYLLDYIAGKKNFDENKTGEIINNLTGINDILNMKLYQDFKNLLTSKGRKYFELVEKIGETLSDNETFEKIIKDLPLIKKIFFKK